MSKLPSVSIVLSSEGSQDVASSLVSITNYPFVEVIMPSADLPRDERQIVCLGGGPDYAERAIHHARGEVIVNFSCKAKIVESQWLSDLVAVLQGHDDAGTVSPVLIGQDGHVICSGCYGGMRGAPVVRQGDGISEPRLVEWNQGLVIGYWSYLVPIAGPLVNNFTIWCSRITLRTELRHWVCPSRVIIDGVEFKSLIDPKRHIARVFTKDDLRGISGI